MRLFRGNNQAEDTEDNIVTSDDNRPRSPSNESIESAENNDITFGGNTIEDEAVRGNLQSLDLHLSLKPEEKEKKIPGLSDISIEHDYKVGEGLIFDPIPEDRAVEHNYQSQSQQFPQPKRRSKASPANNNDQSNTISKNMDPKKLDKAVMLAIEAAKTHEMVRRLFILSVLILSIAFLFMLNLKFYDPFEAKAHEEDGFILVYYQASHDGVASAFEASFLILVVLTLAFRNDFPFNLSVLMLSLFFSGFIFGTVLQRSIYTELGDDFTCEVE